MQHINLPVLNADETEEISREVLEVEPLPEGRFRLLHSPTFIYGAAAGDVIALASEELSGFRVVARAGNLAIVVAFENEQDKNAAETVKLVSSVEKLRGICEGGPKRCLVFTVPVKAGFETVEALFSDFCRSTGTANWWYGNVYDRNDEPLNWWKERIN